VQRTNVGQYDIFCAGITPNSIVVATGSYSYAGIGCITYTGIFELTAYNVIAEVLMDINFSFIIYTP
jgi:hypothetical protein